MKTEMLEKLRAFEHDLRELRKSVKALTVDRVSVKAIRNEAEALANRWVEELRSPLEHKFKINAEVITIMSERIKKLHVLARPNNLKSSYVALLDELLDDYKDKFILPIQQMSMEVENIFDLQKLVSGMPDPDESAYLKEAIDCANSTFKRAAIVMGWCAAIDRIQKKVQYLGFSAFSAMSTQMKQATTGRFKWYTKQFPVATLSDLQAVFDPDLIYVCEGLGLFDSNESERLVKIDFMYRNQCAHPNNTPFEDAHVVVFFTDINKMVLTNSKFDPPTPP